MSDETRKEIPRRAVSGTAAAVNVESLARDLAMAEGIPELLVPAVVARVRFARMAVESLGGYRPLGDGAKVLVRRVVRGAVLDHERGVLERRCGT